MSKSLADKARALSDPNSAESLLRRVRDLERENAAKDRAVKAAEAKRAQAESENVHLSEQLEIFSNTQNVGTTKRLRMAAKGKGHKGRATAVCCLNDWHAEENVESESVNGVNETNLDIISQRIKRTFEKFVFMHNFASHISHIEDIVVWLGGDLINGAIHEELQESNFLGPGDAVLFVQDHLHDGLKHLLKELKKPLRVATNYGNHGRTTKKRRISTGHVHSWEQMAYCNLARHFADTPNISFQVARSYHNWVDIQGFSNRFHHGDAIRFGGGIGGVTIPLKRKMAQWDKQRFADYEWIGHFHQYLDDWRVTLCGCLVGYNAYALEIGAEFQKPTQTFGVIDRQYGKVLATPVFCEEAKA